MNNEHWITEDQPEPWEQRSYRTGYTNQKKSSRGIVAVLLVAVIFLCGIATAFSLLNIRLFKDFAKSESTSVSLRFSNMRSANQPDTSSADTQPQLTFYAEQDFMAGIPVLGTTVQQLSPFDQLYYRLPSGLYITKVQPNTPAAVKGLAVGDILLSIDGQRVTNTYALQQVLYHFNAGDTVAVVLYRNGKQYQVELQLSEAK